MTLALVTGDSRGIGRATALGFARRQVDLVLLGRVSDALEQTAHEARALGRQVEIVPCDLEDAAQVQGAADAVAARPAPDVIVHNAAVIFRKSVEDTTLEEWDRQLAVNLRAPFLLTRALLPAMKRRGSGRIVFVGSISATLGTARSAPYNASKWAVSGFMKSLAQELTDTGVMTVAVLPGSVATTMLNGSGFEPRMTPEDVARTLVHYGLDAPLAHNGGVVEMFGT